VTRETRHLDIETGRDERLSEGTHRRWIASEAVQDKHTDGRTGHMGERFRASEHRRMSRGVGHGPFLADQQPE
jgi:hypothetical protein